MANTDKELIRLGELQIRLNASRKRYLKHPTGQNLKASADIQDKLDAQEKRVGAINEKESRKNPVDHSKSTEYDKNQKKVTEFSPSVGMSLSPPARSSVRRSSGRSGRRGSV